MEKANKKAGKSATQTATVAATTERKPRSVSKSVDKKATKGAAKEQSKGRRSTSKGKQVDQAKKGDKKVVAADKKGGDKRQSSKSKQRDASSKKKGAKKEKDEAPEEDQYIQPTRPIAAYIYFSTENVPKIKADEGVDHRTAMKRAGEIWAKMSDAEKKRYNELNERDQKRYEAQKKEIADKGYFIMEDGSKNTDHVVQGKKKAPKSEKKEKENKKRGSGAAAASKKKAATAKKADAKPRGRPAGKKNETPDESRVEESD